MHLRGQIEYFILLGHGASFLGRLRVLYRERQFFGNQVVIQVNVMNAAVRWIVMFRLMKHSQ